MASSSAPSRQAATTAQAGQTPRIIAGQWRRTPLKVADVPGLRPTPDRVRETAFNWISHQRGGSLAGATVLDLFAGTGALGLEAASRGAQQVTLVENHPVAVRALLGLREKLDARHVEVVHADALSEAQRLARRGARFAVVFLDPPYRQGWFARIVPSVARLVEEDGLVYAESEARLDASLFADHGLDLIRADKAGQVFYHLLRRRTGEDPTEDPPC